ncbi:MAG: hypothetical protein ACPIOQ_49015 [Promethearchaeia archaeon]
MASAASHRQTPTTDSPVLACAAALIQRLLSSPAHEHTGRGGEEAVRRARSSDHLGRINTRKWVVRAPNFALFAFCTQRVPTTAPGLAQCQAHVMRLLPAPAAVAVPAQRRAHTRVAPGLMAGKDRRGAAATMARGAAARRPPAASRGSVRATRDPARNIPEAVWLIGRITIQLCQTISLFWNLCDVVSTAGTRN